ncbi:MAG: histidinol dehydrogenase [Planctomycetota bacterium]|nr:histidinol dehydrogenase [Planctomycetota bacterium]
MPLLTRTTPMEVRRLRHEAVDAATLASAAQIVQGVREGGDAALRGYAERFGDLAPGGVMIVERDGLRAALDRLDRDERVVLERTATRIEAFAQAQRRAIVDVRVGVPGGEAGHTVSPVERAGCYAPGGRFPLPSSVLMTAITARVAGVRDVIVASPKPVDATLAAAAIAGADRLLAVGGAHAIAALAYGTATIEARDVIVGPGNRWVTAAKKLVSGQVGIDMLAGPSELLVLADESADAATVAADLLAQAEHDTDAVPSLVTTSAALVDDVERELEQQLATLPTAATARAALANGCVVLCGTIEEAIGVADALAPEHLEVMTRDAQGVAERLKHYGGLFIGSHSAEVFGDYGVGPNHVLPTGGTARFTGGLSVLNFLRVRTWLRMDAAAGNRETLHAVARDAAALGRIEGLEGHSRSAEQRLPR